MRDRSGLFGSEPAFLARILPGAAAVFCVTSELEKSDDQCADSGCVRSEGFHAFFGILWN